MKEKCTAFAAIVLLLPALARADVTLVELDNDRGRMWVSGEIVSRYENWNWFEPPDQPNDNNDYDYYWARSRFALGFQTKRAELFVQLQDTHIWDLPNNAIAAPPAGAMGIGAVYYAHRRNGNSHGTFIKQGYLQLNDIPIAGLSLKGGRFEYVDALEVTYKDPKVMWLKKVRLAERLIGPFGWSAFTRSFDGGQLSLDRDLFNFTAMASHPTEGGFENDGHHHIDDITVITATLTFKYDKILPRMENRIFYFFYDDDRKVPKVDNTPSGSSLNEGNIEAHTLGFHLLNTREIGPGVGDGLLWGALQWGDWGSLTHNAWAWDIEVGYQLPNLPAKPWLRVGYFISSGDSDSADSEHETFFQLLPTARKYALFPFYNLMNNEDFFVQLILKPAEKITVRADYHVLQLNERDDRWYLGAGATRDRGNTFGYVGRPSFGRRDLAKVLDLAVIYNVSKRVNINAYYGHAWGDDVVENIYRKDDDAHLFYLELGVRI